MKKFRRLLFTVVWTWLASFPSFGCQNAERVPSARYVIVIGIDGMGAEGFQLAHTPYLKQLAKEGAVSIKARSVMPTVSSPAWGSTLTGTGPEQHGMTSNSWLVNNCTIEPTTKDEDGYFPLEVPWIIRGPGVIEDRMIIQPINIYDTASTIAYLFHLEQPYEWVGRPVLGTFETNRELAAKNVGKFVPKPKSSLKSGICVESKEISFSVDEEGAEIRYILGGSDPEADSTLYEKPILLDDSAVVKAIALKDGAKSAISVIRFTRVYGIKEVRLKTKPSEKYQAEGPLSLVDGRRGKSDYQDPAWMGFEKEDLEAVIDFGERRAIYKVGIDCLEYVEFLIFLPTRIELAVSEDGKKFKVIGQVTEPEIKKIEGGPVKLIEKSFKPVKARFLRMRAKNQGACPPGLAGAGEKAWLFVDEIKID